MMKRAISLMLLLVMVLTMCPVTVFAAENEETVPVETVIGTVAETEPEEDSGKTFSGVYVNPVYADVFTEDDLTPFTGIIPRADYDTYTSLDSAANAIKKQMVKRKETITVCLRQNELVDRAEEMLATAMVHTGTYNEGDYLLWNFAGGYYEASYYEENNYYYIVYTYTLTYLTTAAQENKLKEKTTSFLAGLEYLTEYEKIYAIYDYLTSNVVYDDTYEKYSAYNAVVQKSSVCQGYALAYYYLALRAGIDCRIIAGYGNGDDHAWNIVKLGNVYYNIDATWDAELDQAGYDYEYFLRRDSSFPNHTRESVYASNDFYTLYPMATKNAEVVEHVYKNVVTKPTCTAKGYTTHTCTVCGNSYEDSYTEKLDHDFSKGDCTCGALKPPTLTVKINANTGKPVLSWTENAKATYYEIHVTGGRDDTTKSRTYTHSNAVPGTEYTYTVAAMNSVSVPNPGLSNAVTILCRIARPVITVSNDAETGKNVISWKAVEDATNYKVTVHVSENGVLSDAIESINTKSTSVVHENGKAGEIYIYKVRAYTKINAAAYSGRSKAQNRVVDLARPNVKVALKSSTGKPRLSWPAVEDAESYKVFIYDESGELVKTVSTKNLYLNHTSAKAGVKYTYKVRAYMSVSAATSAYSKAVSITSK